MPESQSIIDLLSSHRFRTTKERDLQDGIEKILHDNSIEFVREVVLNKQDRIDFMVGRIGLEVKVGHSWASVVRQLQRYALLPEIDELILVTTKLHHTNLPETIGNKSLKTLVIMGGLL